MVDSFNCILSIQGKDIVSIKIILTEYHPISYPISKRSRSLKKRIGAPIHIPDDKVLDEPVNAPGLIRTPHVHNRKL